ncbi:MAG: nitroreductase family deazaflavin-dependent oxidoreductase [Dehalococcoidia bacterium]
MNRAAEFCYLTTTGRRSGRPHTIEIWFASDGGPLYILSEAGERTDWVKNLRRQSAVTLRIDERTAEASARVVEAAAEAERARRLVAAKYEGWAEGMPFKPWVVSAVPVAVDLPENPPCQIIAIG